MDPTLRKPYPSDLTDEQWELIQRFFPPVLKWCPPRLSPNLPQRDSSRCPAHYGGKYVTSTGNTLAKEES